MKYLSGLRLLFLALACAALPLLGCGGSKAVKVDGKIVKNGAPFTASGNDILGLAFQGEGAEAKSFPATVKQDGTFVANGVAPGHYKLRVSLTSGANDAASLAKSKELNRQFDAVNNKLDYEVSGGDQSITIDIEKGTVTKQ
jgi:hypothetical protein